MGGREERRDSREGTTPAATNGLAGVSLPLARFVSACRCGSRRNGFGRHEHVDRRLHGTHSVEHGAKLGTISGQVANAHRLAPQSGLGAAQESNQMRHRGKNHGRLFMRTRRNV